MEGHPLGLFWDAKVYNMFLLPTLGYIAQLERPPEWVTKGTTRSLSQAAKGPKDWAQPEDLQQLQETFGLKASFKRLDIIAQPLNPAFSTGTAPSDPSITRSTSGSTSNTGSTIGKSSTSTSNGNAGTRMPSSAT